MAASKDVVLTEKNVDTSAKLSVTRDSPAQVLFVKLKFAAIALASTVGFRLSANPMLKGPPSNAILVAGKNSVMKRSQVRSAPLLILKRTKIR
jgi:hypothetical protein